MPLRPCAAPAAAAGASCLACGAAAVCRRLPVFRLWLLGCKAEPKVPLLLEGRHRFRHALLLSAQAGALPPTGSLQQLVADVAAGDAVAHALPRRSQACLLLLLGAACWLLHRHLLPLPLLLLPLLAQCQRARRLGVLQRRRFGCQLGSGRSAAQAGVQRPRRRSLARCWCCSRSVRRRDAATIRLQPLGVL